MEGSDISTYVKLIKKNKYVPEVHFGELLILNKSTLKRKMAKYATRIYLVITAFRGR